MFTERKDVAGVPSARTGRPRKAFMLQLDAALGESVLRLGPLVGADPWHLAWPDRRGRAVFPPRSW